MPEYRCAYCNFAREATDDHIPPKSLFGGTLDGALPSVKACSACNGGASADDEYFRDTLVQYHRVGELPQAKSIVDKMMRGLTLPKKQGYARAVVARLTEVEVATEAGLLLGKQPAIRVNQERLQRVVTRYVRGLHRYHYGEFVPADTPMQILVNPDEINRLSADFETGFRPGVVEVVQRNVFWYVRLRPSARPGDSYWLLVFFDSFPIVAAMRPECPFLPANAV